jgi:hypothetical protein
MQNLFKNKKKLLLVILVGLSIVSLLFIFGQVSNNKTGTTPPKNLTQATYDSITPGVSTIDDVTSKLGKPINTDPNSLEFKSLSPNRNNQVNINQGVVSLVKEIITLKDTRRTTDITKTYGLAQKTLYGPDAGAGFYLFVYPENGIAYIGHPEAGLLLEIWYFPPTNLSNFKASYADNYSESYQPKPDRFD